MFKRDWPFLRSSLPGEGGKQNSSWRAQLWSLRTNSKGWTYRIGDRNRPDPTATGPRYQVVIAAGRELRDLRAKVAEMIWDVKPSRFCGTGPASWCIAPLDVRVEVSLGRIGLIHWLYLSNVWNAWTVLPQDLRLFLNGWQQRVTISINPYVQQLWYSMLYGLPPVYDHHYHNG